MRMALCVLGDESIEQDIVVVRFDHSRTVVLTVSPNNWNRARSPRRTPAVTAIPEMMGNG